MLTANTDFESIIPPDLALAGTTRALPSECRPRAGERKRFLFITNDFPNPFQPTKGLFNLYLARALSQDHDVRVISPIPWVDEWTQRHGASKSRIERSTVLDGVHVYYPRYYYPPKLLRHHYGTFYWRSIRATVWRLLDKQLPDAVLGYWVYPDSHVAAHIARLVGAPVGVIVGGSDVLLLPKARKWRQRIVDVLSNANAVLTVSQHLRDAVSRLGADPAKCHVWSQGVDDSLFFPADRLAARRRLGMPANEKALLWVGRMHPVKALDVLLESSALLLDRGQPFRLYLVGDGPLQKTIEGIVRTRGLAKSVAFVGSQLHHQLPDWYRAADLTLLPSWSEGLPNVLRESLACGTPFVASRVGGIPEIAEGTGSRLVAPGDPTALADAIIAGLAEPGLTKTVPSPSSSWANSAQTLVDIMQPHINSSQSLDSPWWSSYPPALINPGTIANPWRLRQLLRRGSAALLPRGRFFIRGPADSKTIFLTFDDGPHPKHTPRLLDTLSRHGVTATFFVVGRLAERHPHLIRRIAAEGHVVGNHSYLHAHLHNLSAGEALRGIRRTQRLLGELIGQTPTLYRPPRGKISIRKAFGAWRLGLTVALWNVDPRDYACRSAADMVAWFRQRPLSGGDIVLFHDRLPHAEAVLPELIHSARDRGLTFASLPASAQPANTCQELTA